MYNNKLNDSYKNNISNRSPPQLNENNYSSVNSRMFNTSEFNSTQMNFNYSLQMGCSFKISSMLKTSLDPKTETQLSFLTSRMQEFAKYEDESFPSAIQIKGQKVTYKPMMDFFSEEASIFPKDSTGFFLPCSKNSLAFISAVNLLLRNPSLLSRLFENEQTNEAGVYGVWLCECGVWQLVVVDDKMPAMGSQYALHEFVGKEKCVFNMILEKALAKFYEGYENIPKANIMKLLGDLTGCPIDLKNLYELQANEDLWTLIKKWHEGNFLVFFQNSTEGNAYENIGFALIDFVEIIPKDENEILKKILRLKSPLKGVTIQGTYKSPNSFPQEVKKKLKTSTEDDNSFFLALEECIEYFSDIGVCKAQNRFNSNLNALTVKGHKSFIVKFRMNTSCNGTFSFQVQKKHFLDEPQWSYLRVMVAKEQELGKKYQLIAGEYSNKPIFFERSPYEAGDYMVLIEVISKSSANTNITFLSENESNLQFEMEPKKEADMLEIQKSLLKIYAKSLESKSMRIRDFSSSNEPAIKM